MKKLVKKVALNTVVTVSSLSVALLAHSPVLAQSLNLGPFQSLIDDFTAAIQIIGGSLLVLALALAGIGIMMGSDSDTKDKMFNVAKKVVIGGALLFGAGTIGQILQSRFKQL